MTSVAGRNGGESYAHRSSMFTHALLPCFVPALDMFVQGIGMLPEGTIQAALALGADEANELIEGLPKGVVQGEMECLKRCGLDY